MKQIRRVPPVASHQKPTPEQIAVAALHLHVENGSRDGLDLDDWFYAEKLLTQKMGELAQIQFAESTRKAARSTPKIAIHTMDERPLVRAEPRPTSHEETRKRTVQLLSLSYGPSHSPGTALIQRQAA